MRRKERRGERVIDDKLKETEKPFGSTQGIYEEEVFTYKSLQKS